MTIEQEGGGRWQRLQPRERALIIIVGIIAGLALVYVLLSSGGKGKPESFPVTTPRSTSASNPATPTPAVTAPPQSFDDLSGKDPFRPLVASGGVTPVPSPGSSPGSTGGATGSQRVTLIAISGSGTSRTATVEVNSTEYQVKEGDTFAGSYRVKDLTANCGTFVFGDETFTLCVGQEVLK